MPGTAQAGAYGRPNAFVFVAGGLVKVVSARFGSDVPGQRATYVFTSRTRGATFDGGRIISRVAFDEAIPGPGNTISGTASTPTTRFQNTTLESATERFADLSADHPVYGSAVGSAIGLLASRPLVVFTDGITGAARFRVYGGSGDLNDVASWSPATSIGKGFFPAIGFGKRGLFLLSGSGAGPIGVRKWLGTGFGRQVRLADANSSTTSLFEDPGGRLHAIYSDNRKIVHAVSDNGVRWRSETLVARILRTVVDTRVVARADHYGVAVWGEDLARGQYIRVATLRARR